ncbi:MAG TPA: hypothetical protein VGI64_05960 [Streptosporangiaceae bacterium]|jgi:RecJ-like exonuclease
MGAYTDCPRCQATGYRHIAGGWYRQCKRCAGTGQVSTMAGRAWAYVSSRGLLASIRQMSRAAEDYAAEHADRYAEPDEEY